MKTRLTDKLDAVRRDLKRGKPLQVLLIDPGKAVASMYGNSTALALPLLASIASKHKVEADIVNLGKRDKIPNKDYAVVGFTGTSSAHARALNLAKYFQDDRRIIIKGGPAETVDPRAQADSEYPIDISFHGDADDSFEMFLRGLKGDRVKLRDIPGIVYNNGQEVISNLGLPLSSIIMPHPDFLEIERPFSLLLIAGASKMVRVQSMRGCVFGCSYCGIGGPLRGLTPAQTVDYLRHVKAKTKADSIFFEDATFTLDRHPRVKNLGENRNRTKEFCESVRPLELKMAIQTRADCLDEITIDRLWDAGVVALYLGIETTSLSAAKSVNKGVPEDYEEKIKRVISYAISKGMVVSTALITDLGSLDELRNTLNLLFSLRVHEIWFESMKVYPGTALSRGMEELVVRAYRYGVSMEIASEYYLHLDEARVILEKTGITTIGALKKAIEYVPLSWFVNIEDAGTLLLSTNEERYLRGERLKNAVGYWVGFDSHRTHMVNDYRDHIGGPAIMERMAYARFLEIMARHHKRKNAERAGWLEVEAQRAVITC